MSFELAAKRLRMDVVNVSATGSSVTKGESLLDTFHTLEAMGPDVVVLRHPEEGAAALLAEAAAPDTHIVNAGDGQHAHPTQALLDAATILRYRGTLDGLTITIAGDILHSRVARSDAELFSTLGTGAVRIAAPAALMPDDGFAGCQRFTELEPALEGSDVIIMLRVQRERFGDADAPDADAYHRSWGLTTKRLALAADDALVMHPGPMNRGVEIASEVADGPQAVILDQVNMGVYARMATLVEMISDD